MGLRFKRSIGLGKGVRLNLGKGSVGISAGAKGARVSVNSRRGVTSSVGVPGTGLSYSNASGRGGKGALPGPGCLLMLVFLLFAVGLGVLLFWPTSSKAPVAPGPSVVTSSSEGGTRTTVTITPGGQARPIDIIADGVEAYLADQGYPVAHTKKDADHSRVECVVSVPGISDTDGSTKPSNWADIKETLIGLANGAQSAVPDQGDYTVLVIIQSATGDNLVGAMNNKIRYDKYQIDAEAAAQHATEKMVYASATGSKYHSKPNCGNMTSASQITISEAHSRGAYRLLPLLVSNGPNPHTPADLGKKESGDVWEYVSAQAEENGAESVQQTIVRRSVDSIAP